jgi:hypothetical protein
VREFTLDFYHEVRRAFFAARGQGPFLRGLCQHFLDTWSPALRSDRAYEHIYQRDRYRCTNPVCRRSDVTPHHLRFRSHGGGDEDKNLATLCVWCHLHGIHGGRIVARPVGEEIHWRIGCVSPTIVHGRDKVAA